MQRSLSRHYEKKDKCHTGFDETVMQNGKKKKNALRLLPNLSGNKSRIHYLVRLYKFNQKTTPIEPILVVGEYHFDSGRFGFDFGNIRTLACSNGLNIKNVYRNNIAK